MPDEDKTFSGSFVLYLRIWWRQAHTLYRLLFQRYWDLHTKKSPHKTSTSNPLAIRDAKDEFSLVKKRRLPNQNANEKTSQVHNRSPRVSRLVQGLLLWKAPLRRLLKNKKTRTQWRERNETLLCWQSSFKQKEKHEVK